MPVVAAAAIVGGTSLIASRNSSRAAQQAAQASQNATDQSIALQREQFDRMWNATQTSRQAGEAATGRLASLSGLSVNGQPAMTGQQVTDWIRSTPGYDLNLREGQRSLTSSLAGRGMATSGAAARAALQYGQQYADRVYNTERNALQSIAGLGQTALSQGQQAGSQYVNAASNALQNNARNLSSSYQDRANAQNEGLGGVAGAALFGLRGTNQSAFRFWGGY